MTRARETADLLTAQEVTGNINLSGIVSATSIESSTTVTASVVKVGSGVTLDNGGNAFFAGDISLSGSIIYSSGLTEMQPSGTYLADNSIFGDWDGQLDLTFSSNVEVVPGSSCIAQIKKNSVNGEVLATAGISSISTPGGDLKVLRINFGANNIGTSFKSGISTYYPIIPCGMIQFSADSSPYEGNYSGETRASSCTFELSSAENPGDAGDGGYHICQSGGISWVVAPYSTEINRGWYCYSDAVGVASAATGCPDWFVADCNQHYNPGYLCCTYWDTVSPTNYWTSTFGGQGRAYLINMTTGVRSNAEHTPWGTPSPGQACIRAFRCVTY